MIPFRGNRFGAFMANQPKKVTDRPSSGTQEVSQVPPIPWKTQGKRSKTSLNGKMENPRNPPIRGCGSKKFGAGAKPQVLVFVSKGRSIRAPCGDRPNPRLQAQAGEEDSGEDQRLGGGVSSQGARTSRCSIEVWARQKPKKGTLPWTKSISHRKKVPYRGQNP